MPEDIVAALNEDELVDLVAYLETLKLAALTPDSFYVVGPFHAKSMDEAADKEYGPEKGAFDAKVKFGSLAWKTLRARREGLLRSRYAARKHGQQLRFLYVCRD